MLKKLTLLALAVGALVAFAAPAAANAEFTPEGTYDLTGSLSTTAAGGAFESGPCQVHAMITVDSTGHATVDTFTITTPCPTSVPGCSAANVGSIGTPWTVDNEGTEVTITEAGLFNVYSGASCAFVGIPTGVPLAATGDATGIMNNETHCIEFAESGDLEGALGPVTIDGEVCDATETLEAH